MRITNSNLTRLAGIAAVLAGICYVIVGIFHPANVPASVTSDRWAVVHVIACLMSIFGVIGLTGLYARQAEKTGWLGLAGYLLLTFWFVLIMGFTFVEAFILPKIAATNPAFVAGWMGFLVGPATKADMGALPGLWTLSAPLYILGGLSFGIATFRAGILPRLSGALLALGTVLAPLAAAVPNAAQPKIAIPTGLALAWMGYALWSERRTDIAEPGNREMAKAA